MNQDSRDAMDDIKKFRHKTFEELRHETEDGGEYWSARELYPVLEYAQWRNFETVIGKAKEACTNSGHDSGEHFADASKVLYVGNNEPMPVSDYHLSRYACYLIVQNGDPSKPAISAGQTYFAIQTRRQELADDEAFQELSEEKKRIYLRNEMRTHNKQLVDAARQSGVLTDLDYAIFQNHGYKGLYGGLDAKAIHARKGLKKSQKILDHMGSTELAANLFRATQAEEKLRRDQVRGKNRANAVHFEVGKAVRNTIKELGGTMPEDLPTPSKGIPQLEKERKKLPDQDK